MWVRVISGLFLFSFAFAQLKLEPPTPEPGKDPREQEKQAVERKTGGNAPELIPPPPPPPPPPSGEKQEPAKVDPRQFKINRSRFSIVAGQPLNEKEKSQKGQMGQTQAQTPSATEDPLGGQERKTIAFEGYCRLLEDISLTIEPAWGQVECFSRNRVYRGTMKFVPEVENYSLRGQLEKLQGYSVISSEVYTADRTSRNIAKEVDTRLIANILLRAGRETGKQTADVLQQAFQPQRTITGTGSLTVVETNTKETLKQIPDFALYSAIANLLSASSDEILRDKRRLPPLFKVVKGQEFYVKAQVCVRGCQ